VKISSLVLGLALLVAACGTDEAAESSSTVATSTTTTAGAAPAQATQTGAGQGGMVASAGMRDRHQAPIPAEYSGLTNPVPADEESLARGAEAYATCAVCHGDTGLGDGAAGASLDPAPVNIAHTSQMMSDAYFFWRISEGGAEFATLMPAWKDAFDEQTRWDLINYIQGLGEGIVAGPGSGMGMGQGQGMGMGPGANTQAQAIQQAALLEAAVEQGVITQAEADDFAAIHPAVDARVAELRGTGLDQTSMLETALTELVAAGDITQAEADTFQAVHDSLSEAGLLP
jgi:mono/diheme cytochrome c family protein